MKTPMDNKTGELRALLDERGIRWDDCPEMYGHNADGRGLTLPATRFWVGGAVYVASEVVAYHLPTHSVTEMKVTTVLPDAQAVIKAVVG